MSIRSVAPVLGLLVLSVSPALAITVTNQDKREHTLTIDRGAEEKDATIAPGASLRVDCPDGCSLRTRTAGYDSAAETGDRWVIRQDGLLHPAGEDLATGSLRDKPAADRGGKAPTR
ncbi:hypothetical protein M446_5714 [Methylobacterium sp. 4-46]|uniref:hypothetical protein n=1 Tax=unclassified Methylobacterium TaxID=2615210 RepID=UPI000152E6D4|nr:MULTISPECIES: hypothetical protein [Methylobacterium]ACA20004.1 hypothetical protein M446_5714 [Methylobacterium sp. 4-46]WFT79190.1 hypothetical protein QA634_28840 [Methylobacterium nodulans]